MGGFSWWTGGYDGRKGTMFSVTAGYDFGKRPPLTKSDMGFLSSSIFHIQNGFLFLTALFGFFSII